MARLFTDSLPAPEDVMFNLYGDKIPIADDPTWRVPMTDYKPFYECELKRADKAEDALAAAIARVEVAENDSRAWEALAARAEAIVMVQQDKIAALEAQLAWQYNEKPPKVGHYNVRATGRLDRDGYWHIYVGAALVGAIDHAADIHWQQWRPIDPPNPA